MNCSIVHKGVQRGGGPSPTLSKPFPKSRPPPFFESSVRPYSFSIISVSKILASLLDTYRENYENLCALQIKESGHIFLTPCISQVVIKFIFLPDISISSFSLPLHVKFKFFKGLFEILRTYSKYSHRDYMFI